jgi:transcription termination factor Rho
MELVLSRDLANDRLFPAIDIPASGTRKEHLLIGRRLPEYNALRRHLTSLKPKDAYKALTTALAKFDTNSILLNHMSAV